MKKYFIYAWFFCALSPLKGQLVAFCVGENLFPNPSFEEYTDCPDNYSGILTGHCKDWTSAGGSPDYFNCTFLGGGNSMIGPISGVPSDGNGVVGIWSLPTNIFCNGRLQSEPIKGVLKDTLIPNKEYLVSFDVRIDLSGSSLDTNGNPCVDFGMIFYKGNISNLASGCGCFTKTPQILISNEEIPFRKYRRFTISFIPDDYYTKVIIGPMCNPNMGIGDCATPLDNFGPFANYINLDNLSLKELACVYISDTSICQYSCIDSLLFSHNSPNAYWELTSQENVISGNNLINNNICFQDTGYYSLKTAGFNIPNIVHVSLGPTVHLGNDTSLCMGASITLNAGDDNGVYLWNQGTTTSTLTVMEEGLYSVQKSFGDCTSLDTLNVEFLDCEKCISFPNAFTPNEDMVNDYFYPVIQCPDRIIVISMEVYNRWGQKIYAGKGPWNGEHNSVKLPEDVYVWKVVYEESQHNSPRNMVKHGEVALLR